MRIAWLIRRLSIPVAIAFAAETRWPKQVRDVRYFPESGLGTAAKDPDVRRSLQRTSGFADRRVKVIPRDS